MNIFYAKKKSMIVLGLIEGLKKLFEEHRASKTLR